MSNQKNTFHHALKIDAEKCIACTRCMKVCPTNAIRIKNGSAFLLENNCIDCGECYRACPVNAIEIEQDDFNKIFDYKYRIALVPAVFIGQFPADIKTKTIYAGLKELGFTHVYEVEHGVKFLSDVYENYMNESDKKPPFISPFCPAVVRLIQVRFPSLVEKLIHFKAPLDVASIIIRKRLTDAGILDKDIGVFYITPCAAKIASVKSPVEGISTITGAINLDLIYNKTYRIIANSKNSTDPINHELNGDDILWSLTNGEASYFEGRSFAIDGVRNVIEFLEKLENNEISDVDFIELRVCDQGCVGGVLCSNNRFVSVERLKNRSKKIKKLNKNNTNTKDTWQYSLNSKFIDLIKVDNIKPRSIEKLDDNLEIALKKAEELQEILEILPKIDCCMCGSPSCQAFAKDIINGYTTLDNCIFLNKNNSNIHNKLNKVWSKKK